MKHIFVSVSVGAILLVVLIALAGGLDWLFQIRVRIRLTNLSGSAVAVISGNTHETTKIPNGATVIVPHAYGDITVQQLGGSDWVYKRVSVLECDAKYQAKRHYLVPFGGGTITVDYLLDKQRRLYIVSPGVKDMVIARQEGQPRGYPLEPSEGEKK